MLLGRYYLDRNNLAPAAQEMDMAISTAVPKRDSDQQSPRDLMLSANLYYWRSQVYRRKEDFVLATQDIETAMRFAQIAKNDTAVAYYQEQQTIINNHASMAHKRN